MAKKSVLELLVLSCSKNSPTKEDPGGGGWVGLGKVYVFRFFDRLRLPVSLVPVKNQTSRI